MYIRGADHHVLTKKGRLSVIFGYSRKLEQLKLARRQVCPRFAPQKSVAGQQVSVWDRLTYMCRQITDRWLSWLVSNLLLGLLHWVFRFRPLSHRTVVEPNVLEIENFRQHEPRRSSM